MASLSHAVDLSNLDEFFEVSRGPSFKDLFNAAFFDSEQLLEFRFKDDRHPIIGTLAGYVPGGAQFCLVAVEHHAGRGGSAEIAYFFYSPSRRLGKRIYPKSLKQLLDYNGKGEQLDLDPAKLKNLESELKALLELFKKKNFNPEFGPWMLALKKNLADVHELEAEILGLA